MEIIGEVVEVQTHYYTWYCAYFAALHTSIIPIDNLRVQQIIQMQALHKSMGNFPPDQLPAQAHHILTLAF